MWHILYPSAPLRRVFFQLCKRTHSSSPGGCRPRGIRVRNKHADHPILPGREEKLAVAGSTDMQIGPRDACTHRSIDEFLQRHILPIAAPVPHVRREWEQLAELAAAPPAVLPVSLPFHPAVVLAIADDVDLLDVVHPDVGGEHGSVCVP